MVDFNLEKETGDPFGEAFLSAWNYWEKRGRIRFNLIVGITGVIAIFYLNGKYPIDLLFGAFLWGVVANAFYSTGYLIESWLIMRKYNSSSLKEARVALFFIGTAISVLLTLMMVYFFTHPDFMGFSPNQTDF